MSIIFDLNKRLENNEISNKEYIEALQLDAQSKTGTTVKSPVTASSGGDIHSLNKQLESGELTNEQYISTLQTSYQEKQRELSGMPNVSTVVSPTPTTPPANNQTVAPPTQPSASQTFQPSQTAPTQTAPAPVPAPVPAPIQPSQPAPAPTLGGQANQPYSQEVMALLQELKNANFQSPRIGQIEQILAEAQQPFQYDPTQDVGLQAAQGQVQQSVMEETGARGILSSTITGDRMVQGTAALVPEFEKIARDEYQQDINTKLNIASFLSDLDTKEYKTFQDKTQRTQEIADFILKLGDREYQIYRDEVSQSYNNEKLAFEKSLASLDIQRKAVSDAWDRVSQLGYVDNESALTLGVAVGTLSADARNSREDKEFELYIYERELSDQREDTLLKYNIELQMMRERDIVDAEAAKQRQEFELAETIRQEDVDRVETIRREDVDVAETIRREAAGTTESIRQEGVDIEESIRQEKVDIEETIRREAADLNEVYVKQAFTRNENIRRDAVSATNKVSNDTDLANKEGAEKDLYGTYYELSNSSLAESRAFLDAESRNIIDEYDIATYENLLDIQKKKEASGVDTKNLDGLYTDFYRKYDLNQANMWLELKRDSIIADFGVEAFQELTDLNYKLQNR